ncbi:MAG: hypothetical protein ACT4QB_21055 [Gammaproteobacteria bacterium]
MTVIAGQVLTGPLFNEPMRVETVQANGPASWVLGLVGTPSERFRKVTLTAEDIGRLMIIDARYSFDGDGRLLRLGLQAYALSIAYEFDPYFGLLISRVDPLLLEKLQEIRDALDDDAVFNVIGEVLPAAHVERVLRDYYAGRLGDADLEERLLRDVDERQFRAICQNALEGLASKKLNLEMLIERRARAQERRVVPETIARFLREAAELVPLALKTIPSLPHTFEPPRTPPVLRRYEKDPAWKLPALADRYSRCSTDREAAETEKLEWVTPGHPLFEAIRRHTHAQALEVLGKGATFHSLQYEQPARIDFYRARVVDGLGQVIHERLFAVEIAEEGEPRLREPGLLGDFAPANPPGEMPVVATLPEPGAWLHEHALAPFLDETRNDRLAEVERVAAHVELSLTELLQRADEEIGRAAAEVEQKIAGAEGRIAQAEMRHSELLARRERRRIDFERQRALTLQAVERLASVLVLPHPERETPEVRRLQPNFETEATAMRVVMEHECAQGRQVYDRLGEEPGLRRHEPGPRLRRAAAHRGEGARRGEWHHPTHP